MEKRNNPDIIQHFSHPHPLKLCNHPSHQTSNILITSCAGCKLNASGLIYTCTPCSYFLHISCSQMPQKITHLCDQNHVLSLLPTAIYPGGIFSCNACMKHGNAFVYHCGACDIDLHTNCASMPLLLTHQSHHHHQLNLTFSLPSSNTFICDICNRAGYKEWLYWCSPCDFTAHLGCATAEPRAPTQFQTRATPLFVPSINNNVWPSIGRSGQGNSFVNHALQSRLGQTMIQQLLGGGGGSSNLGLCQTMIQQLLGGGGGSSNLGLGQTMIQQLLGGGGGSSNLGLGQTMIQQLLGGGGGSGGNGFGGGITDFGSSASDPLGGFTDYFSATGGVGYDFSFL